MTHPIPASAHPGVRAWHASLGLARRPLLGGVSGTWPDLSEFQTVDWVALGQAYTDGIVAGVIMRASFGTARADRTFAVNQREARARGIPRAFYHFCYPSVNSAAAEATFFNAVGGPLQPLEAMIGDFEDDGPNLFPRGAAGLQWAEAFLAALQTPVNATWSYSYPSLISNVGLQPLWLTWPFWLADYGTTPDSVFTYATLRQFTDCGSTPGVSGCCDQSRVLRAPMSQWLTPGGGMTDQQILDAIASAVSAAKDDAAGGMIRGVFLTLGRGDPTQDEYAWWLARSRQVGIQQAVADMLDGFTTSAGVQSGYPDEAVRHRQLEADYEAGKLASAVAPDHKHPFSATGTSGPPA